MGSKAKRARARAAERGGELLSQTYLKAAVTAEQANEKRLWCATCHGRAKPYKTATEEGWECRKCGRREATKKPEPLILLTDDIKKEPGAGLYLPKPIAAELEGKKVKPWPVI